MNTKHLKDMLSEILKDMEEGDLYNAFCRGHNCPECKLQKKDCCILLAFFHSSKNLFECLRDA